MGKGCRLLSALEKFITMLSGVTFKGKGTITFDDSDSTAE